MNKKHRLNNQGMAMIVCLVVIMVVMVFCLSLLLLSYSLYSSSSKELTEKQCNVLAKTLARQINEQLTQSEIERDWTEESYETEKKFMIEALEEPLWSYIRCNIWQKNWPYYNEDENGHTSEYADRYFSIKTDQDSNMADEILMKISWESDMKKFDESIKDGTLLHVSIIVKKNDSQYVSSAIYELNITDEEKVDKEKTDIIDNIKINPSHNRIVKGEKWGWSLYDNK